MNASEIILYIFSIDCFYLNYISPITTLFTTFTETTNDKGKDNTTHKGKEYVFSYGWIKSHVLLNKNIEEFKFIPWINYYQ